MESEQESLLPNKPVSPVSKRKQPSDSELITERSKKRRNSQTCENGSPLEKDDQASNSDASDTSSKTETDDPGEKSEVLNSPSAVGEESYSSFCGATSSASQDVATHPVEKPNEDLIREYQKDIQDYITKIRTAEREWKHWMNQKALKEVEIMAIRKATLFTKAADAAVKRNQLQAIATDKSGKNGAGQNSLISNHLAGAANTNTIVANSTEDLQVCVPVAQKADTRLNSSSKESNPVDSSPPRIRLSFPKKVYDDNQPVKLKKLSFSNHLPNTVSFGEMLVGFANKNKERNMEQGTPTPNDVKKAPVPTVSKANTPVLKNTTKEREVASSNRCFSGITQGSNTLAKLLSPFKSKNANKNDNNYKPRKSLPKQSLLDHGSISLKNLLESSKEQDDNETTATNPKCQGCGAKKAEFICAGCGNQWYCSRECQVASWNQHADVCCFLST